MWRLFASLFVDCQVCSWRTPFLDLRTKVMPMFLIGVMAVDKNGNSADKGPLDPNCPVFASLNLAFPDPSWDDAQRAVSTLHWLLITFPLSFCMLPCTAYLFSSLSMGGWVDHKKNFEPPCSKNKV